MCLFIFSFFQISDQFPETSGTTGCPKKSIPFEMKPLLEVNALLLC